MDKYMLNVLNALCVRQYYSWTDILSIYVIGKFLKCNLKILKKYETYKMSAC